ncbi:uncharacterized protein LOC142634697 [Castanea sativa]|uniref:uncharacterized protein LOC142634697 n=1 Tax=Castanea sativa TaxID=21020 RepID=UPI003F64EF69
MRLLSWNCQGLGNCWTVRSLHDLVKDHVPNVCFLMETRLDRDGFMKHCRDLAYLNILIVKKRDSGGGLALLWKEEVRLEVINYTENHVLVKVVEVDGFLWFLTGFYGWPELSQKHKSWALLRHLYSLVTGPWCCIGDFNAFLHSSEKLSTYPPQVRQMDEFRAVLEDCHLIDLGFQGYKFTWNNKRPGAANTRERLDRAVANKEWFDKFSESTVSYKFSHSLDHMPIILHTGLDNRFHGRVAWGFKFEEVWLLMEECENLVEEAWDRIGSGGPPLVNINNKRRHCGAELQAWGSNRTNPQVAEIKRPKKVLERLNESDQNEATRSDFVVASMCDRTEECLNAVTHRMSPEMLNILSSEYCADEVKMALFQMGPTKAPGPDVKSPEKMSEFKPISLCNVIYKIISKVLANRLKLILPQLISPTQSALVPGRLITDNVLVTYETLHAMHGRRKGKKGALALKLDISKAYDRVEWFFLKGMMIKLGFPQGWLDWVMSCVNTSSFSVWINGKAYGNFKPTRGIRQGDPLSPYLFLICAEAFTSLLAKEEENGRLHGVSISWTAPTISYLLFADDSLLFCQTKQKEVQLLFEVLEFYAVASGQCINLEKSSVFFSSNTTEAQREWITNVLGVKEVERFESYLGLPTLVGRSKYQAFSFLKERVWKTIQGWKGKLLSKADSIFHRFDAEAIYRIPLSRRCVPDVLVWLHNKNGWYSVKLGYHTTRLLLKETNRVGEGSVLMSSSKQLSVDAIEIFLVQSWLIWNQRNMVLHGAKLQEPGRLNERANSLLVEYKNAQSQLAIPVSSSVPQSWQPPEGTLYKLNFDAAVFTDMAASGVGVIIWNYNGQVMAALSSKGPTVLDSEEAEILACRQAMKFAIDAGFSELVVEGDNINVMCSIFSDRTDWSRLGNIYDDICWLAGRLRHVEFQSIRRSANGVAYSLA